ncbi:protein tyrosine phosphatase domain-containing protein 1 [Cheilinus undulatus]|uniref:protein tyrosine phosphatase domain-containing protein 1 n=1 Tax=Cheilinus undulatus TaxID=241271 RepID=UPI001BD3269F|nr:protein tyrosine phosphatase domain-containing protein 1 [Cheilinus undulatus]
MKPTFAPHTPVPQPSYSQARENLVKAIPPKLLCLLACGGLDCRYEGPECWRLNQQAIRGVFSSWVTDDIIAMARPSNHLIEKYNIIDQFKRLNIKSIINMQLPGEHAHCGPALDCQSGFTYSPQIFMDSDIYFYNFGMPDFGVSSLVGVIDAVKVLTFAVKEGKVAVHCHAGLGRTGVLIACYLIYTLHISPSEAVHFVRIKRPRSIQTRAQISQVFDFARLTGTQLVQYPDLSLRHGAPFTLQHYLNRQALLLHGQEARSLRHIPKVIYLLCVRLSCLALGLPAPPDVHAELDKRAALRSLGRLVRETLAAKQYLPLLREGHQGSWLDTDSVSSWDEPLGFIEGEGEVLLDRRSYSDSDLNKITNSENLERSPYCTPALRNLRLWCVQDLKADLIPKKKSYKLDIPISHIGTSIDCTERCTCTAKKQLYKSISITKLGRNSQHPGPSSAARTVAKAMADPGPAGETILQRSALLQEELNSSECGWALLVTESDPHVLSCLLWTWLEKLREPVLGAEDVDKLSQGANNKKPLSVLRKPQRHTVYCLLSCVSTVSRFCPHREEALLSRLMRSLTKRPLEEMESLASLMEVLKSSLRETCHNYQHHSRTCSTDATL